MNTIWIAVGALTLLGLVFGAILGYASRRFAVEDDPVVEKIDAILPQSQCGQCGYPGCRPLRRSRGSPGRENQSLRARRRSRHAENCRVAKRRAAAMRW
ncbi:ferredoxin-like protein, cytoplasmic membrane [Salmonella enterica subsp. enterica]|uniref:Ferredoxin-like protein, cytoplasmic membrane n=1 Tax=Salmonella enterica I TaxID=59201 RepID=A0A3S4LYJ5_SALET|nr:ferredoxin-like protein, cytoplasmic membrane [Salmonella enterica subsp. enterica]